MLDTFNILIAELILWTQNNREWAAAIVFLIAFSESLAVVGVAVPGIAVMVAISGLIGAGEISLWPVLLSAITGAILGDQISFWLGRRFGVKLWAVWPLNRDPTLIAKSTAFFERHGGKSVALGRFIGPIRALVPAVAGMSSMPYRWFTTVNIISAIFWAPVYLLPGAFFGKSLGESAALPLWIAFVAVAGTLVGAWILRPRGNGSE